MSPVCHLILTHMFVIGKPYEIMVGMNYLQAKIYLNSISLSVLCAI